MFVCYISNSCLNLIFYKIPECSCFAIRRANKLLAQLYLEYKIGAGLRFTYFVHFKYNLMPTLVLLNAPAEIVKMFSLLESCFARH